MPDRRAEFASDAVAIDRRRVECAVDGCNEEAILPLNLCDKHMEPDKPFVAEEVQECSSGKVKIYCYNCLRELQLTWGKIERLPTHYREGSVPVKACQRCERVFS